MNMNWQSRTELLLGKEKLDKLGSANVLVVGLGGVGAYAAEMICRAGVGKMTIVDGDTVNETNINRQLVALGSTVGEKKTDVLGDRLLYINPELDLTKIDEYIDEYCLWQPDVHIEFCKGDSHQALYDECSSQRFFYYNYPAGSDASEWVQTNYKKGRSGIVFYNYWDNDNPINKSEHKLWFKWGK